MQSAARATAGVLPSTVSVAERAPGGAWRVVEEAGFRVRRVYCVGRNYREHAEEMARRHEALSLEPGDVRAPPFFFQKPGYGAVVDTSAQQTVPYPARTALLEFEGELVLALKGPAGANLSPDQARDSVWGFGLGCDLTRRDLQNDAKAARRPWDAAKAFDNSAPLGPLCATAQPQPHDRLLVTVDGQVRQDSTLEHMIFQMHETIVELSKEVSLGAGDLIFTGTPAGVGPITRGQTFSCELKRGGEDVLPPCTFTLG